MRTLILENYKDKANFFDAQTDAPWAMECYGREEWAKLERIQSELGNLEGKNILEPGCGTGRLTEILSDWVGTSGSVTALDISRGMITKARQRLTEKNNVTLLCDALENLNPPLEAFDVILHHQVFPHYNDQSLALDISSRFVKPGGKVIVFHFINLECINDTHRKAGTAVERDMMPDENEIYRMFTAAGLKISFIFDDENGYFLSAYRPEVK